MTRPEWENPQIMPCLARNGNLVKLLPLTSSVFYYRHVWTSSVLSGIFETFGEELLIGVFFDYCCAGLICIDAIESFVYIMNQHLFSPWAVFGEHYRLDQMAFDLSQPRGPASQKELGQLFKIYVGILYFESSFAEQELIRWLERVYTTVRGQQ